MINEYKKRIDAISEKIDRLKIELADEQKSAFDNLRVELFEKHSKLHSFSWRQYTPYFNDGDPCTFRTSTSYPDIIVLDSEGDEELFEDGCNAPADIKADISAFLELLDKDYLERQYGDGYKVTVTKDGVETEDYDHD